MRRRKKNKLTFQGGKRSFQFIRITKRGKGFTKEERDSSLITSRRKNDLSRLRVEEPEGEEGEKGGDSSSRDKVSCPARKFFHLPNRMGKKHRTFPCLIRIKGNFPE